MLESRSRRAVISRRRLPPAHWAQVWAAWCPVCEQETMPLNTGCCGFCDTNLAGQVTRGPYDPPILDGHHRVAASAPLPVRSVDGTHWSRAVAAVLESNAA